MIDQDKIHQQCLSDDPEERIEGSKQLQSNFSLLPDKQKAWEDLHRLTADQNGDIRYWAAYAFGSAFQYVTDKQQAWEDLHRLADDQNVDVRYGATDALYYAFSHVPNKQQAWEDLIRLTADQEDGVRSRAASALDSAFSCVPDKQQVLEDLHRLTADQDGNVRYGAANALGSVFSCVPDKQKAWEDLHRLTADQEEFVRSRAASVLGSAFSQISDKQQAWEDLHRLTSDQDRNVRYVATITLHSAFSYIPDKQKAWEDLIRLTSDKSQIIRSRAIYALGSAYSHIPDKQKAWEDLVRLTSDKDRFVRSKITSFLGFALSHMQDKQKAWEDLHRLTLDQDGDVRYEATSVLGFAFSHMPDKQKAWEDLHRLTSDQEENVRRGAVYALGFSYSHFPDKQKAWEDLIRLTSDQDSSMRMHANHSLAKASIFKASQARTEEDYKNELEKAIDFFEKAAQESAHARSYFNPSQFCLPFYRSFYTIVFKKQGAKEEVDKYLAEAKDAIEGSKSKEILLEAVNNLANALNEVQNLENLELEAKKDKLNSYRQYCDRAAELMIDSEEAAPHATGVLKKGLPIFGRNLKELLEEIQKRTGLIREQTKGTQFEELGDELNQNSQSLSEVRDPVGFRKQVNSMQNTLKAICSKFPEGQKGEACELLEMMYAEPSIEDKIPLLVNILSKFSYQLDMTAQLNRFEEKLDQKLSCISFDIFKIKLNSHNVISKLDTMKKELEKLNETEVLNALSIDNLNSTQAEKLNDLKNDLKKRLEDIEFLVKKLPNNEDNKEITNLLSKLKQSDSNILQSSSGIASIISLILSFTQLYQQYVPA